MNGSEHHRVSSIRLNTIALVIGIFLELAASSCVAQVSNSSSDCLFNWAESTYPSLFAPSGIKSQAFGPYYLRSYTQTNSSLSVSAEHLYYVGPLSANSSLDLGPALGWYASSGCVALGGDIAAPTVPTGLTPVPASTKQINVYWNASTDTTGVTGYKVYRNGVLVGSPTLTNFSDTGLNPSTTYSYTVSACDAAGNCSAQAASASAATFAGDVTAPSVPTGLTPVPGNIDRINVYWNASTDAVGVTGYKVYRNGVLVGSPTLTNYSDTGLTHSTTYSYTVAACDLAGNCSAQTAAASAMTWVADTTAPTVPTGLTPVTASTARIDIYWNASTDTSGVSGYKVYRNGVLVGSPTVSNYSDNVSALTSYSYTVSACDGAGNCSAQTAPAYSSVASTAPQFPLASAISVFFQTSHDITLNAIDGSDLYTFQYSFRPGPQTAFEGHLSSTMFQSIIIRLNGVAITTGSGTTYFDASPYKGIGTTTSDGSYTVTTTQQLLPANASVGQSGVLSTSKTYTNSSKTSLSSTSTNIWSLESDTSTTAWACFNSSDAAAGSSSSATSDCYKVDLSGNVIALKKTRFLNGQSLTIK